MTPPNHALHPTPPSASCWQSAPAVGGVGELGSLGGTTRMPSLTFPQLAKVFGAGFLGYAVIVVLTAVGVAFLFPNFIGGTLDMSADTYFKAVFIYFGLLGVVAAVLMLAGAWCILRFFRQSVEYDRAA